MNTFSFDGGLDQMNITYENAWVAVGNIENWERGFENGIWGIVPELENHWFKIQPGDLVLFYCKAPVKGFVGAGIIRSKFKQTEPYWKQEISENHVIWPYRFEFDVTHLVPLGSWRKLAVSNQDYHLAILAGLNPVADFEKALLVLDKLKFTIIEPVKPEKEIAASIFEMGKIQRMFVEADFPVESNYLDVIWKRTIRSVPTFAFAINLEGGFDQSLQTLKHAHDIWNSRPFLITNQEKIENANDLISGTYHELSSALKILSVPQIQGLYDSKKNYYDLEEKYGLR